jgi:hypothetical protein
MACNSDRFELGSGGGLATAAMGILAVVFHPDTGHVPRYAVPLMLGIPGFILGLLAGAALWAFSQGRLTSEMTIIIGAWLAAVLGWHRHSKRHTGIS